MKKIFSLILVVAALSTFFACKPEDFDSKYYDPSKTTTVSPDKMMTGAFMAGRDYTFNAYWRMYTWDNYMGKLAQTIGFGVQSGTMYYINDGYASDRWGNFYKTLTQYRVAQKVWEAEGDTLDLTCRDKFRTKSNCNQWLMKFWQLCEGIAVPRDKKIGRCFHIKDNIYNEMLGSIGSGRYKLICVNDTVGTRDFELQKQQVIEAFEKLLPEKSGFEI